MRSFLCTLALVVAATPAFADGPKDNLVDNVRQIPPPGIEVPAEVRESLTKGAAALKQQIDQLQAGKDEKAKLLVPDVEIFWRAIDGALRFNEFSDAKEFDVAKKLLAEGNARAVALLKGEAPWTKQTGLVVRGFRSRIDGTVQPYGLLIPDDYRFDGEVPVRCDLWLHGRFEKQCELQFINMRMNQKGEIQPAKTIVVHPYGRFSNAFKFAGEVDVLEALAHAKSRYRIDDDRVAIRGFSMGGAGVWQMTVHYPDRFFASTPGAGFSETPEFLKVFQQETLSPPAWEQTLWNLYDAPGWVGNLRMMPTIAYSGEIDKQKQAADVMAAACEKEGITLTHLIGPQTAHKLHPDSKAEIERRLVEIAKRADAVPAKVDFTTYSLRYNRCDWVTIHGMNEHWKPARIQAAVVNGALQVLTDNVSEFEIHLPSGSADLLSPTSSIEIGPIGWTPRTDNPRDKAGLYALAGAGRWQPTTDRSIRVRVHWREPGAWSKMAGFWAGPSEASGLRKRHGLQGPIDDAFMDSFLFVKPTGKPLNDAVGKWADSEFNHAVTHWRQQMRGDARVKSDSEITDADIAAHNLVLWGDPQSNSLLARVLPKLPVTWSAEGVTVNGQKYEAGSRVPVLIYPNPLNPNRYVVLNSSFTYREYDYLNNARQTPKLPDWAVIDIRTPVNSRYPGKIEAAGFFDESWRFKSAPAANSSKN
ncbi:Prolyl oligopeptidase family protein [Caulifigura coniformis]|uniref:Prolyl oligopeptidase family protein n=1 Tax=Caulifigura coniformis TaxID=2527983 RepID=A0A517S9X2_9PLAN|nr:prolyl oligopeptidase family serine peptidase [Caulifigura coniformis]QDT52935.1 Prolyl oligopeptidase family protein [Caulifigura coniformis]